MEAPFKRYWLASGLVNSQGDNTTNSESARLKFGVDGSGVKLGIISDSFNKLGGASASVTSGELPGATNPNGFTTPVDIVKDDLSAARTDEGRAMAEIVHDLAPGAQLFFHSAFNNPSGPSGLESVAFAIDALVSSNVDIVVDDVRQGLDPFFQKGFTAQSAEQAVVSGVHYFTAAFNDGNESLENDFTPSLGGSLHDFKPGSGTDLNPEPTTLAMFLTLGACGRRPRRTRI